MSNIPQSEIDIVIEQIRSKPEYLDPEHVLSIYESYGLEVISDPWSEDVVTPIRTALQKQIPFSVIRIGDGEANFMTYGGYSNTRHLDQYAVKGALELHHQDSFIVDEDWMIILRDLMLGAIAQADIVGVTGLWRPAPVTVEKIIEMFLQDYRGVSGHWRAIDYMLTLGRNNYLLRKIIASAHLYLSLLEHLHVIVPLSQKVIILSSMESNMKNLKIKYPYVDFEYIPVGDTVDRSNRPTFLFKIFAALPQDMSGCLCLIGAGPWAEIYCTWVKQRGGVALDIGSGFDLLDGKLLRPIHKLLDQGRIKSYDLNAN